MFRRETHLGVYNRLLKVQLVHTGQPILDPLYVIEQRAVQEDDQLPPQQHAFVGRREPMCEGMRDDGHFCRVRMLGILLTEADETFYESVILQGGMHAGEVPVDQFVVILRVLRVDGITVRYDRCFTLLHSHTHCILARKNSLLEELVRRLLVNLAQSRHAAVDIELYPGSWLREKLEEDVMTRR